MTDQTARALRIILPGAPISVNHAYLLLPKKPGIKRRLRIPTKVMYDLQARWTPIVKAQARGWKPPNRTYLTFEMTVYNPRAFVRGGEPRGDTSNWIKITEDIVARAVGYDDRWHTVVRAERVRAYFRPRADMLPGVYTVIRIEVMDAPT